MITQLRLYLDSISIQLRVVHSDKQRVPGFLYTMRALSTLGTIFLSDIQLCRATQKISLFPVYRPDELQLIRAD